MVEDEASIRDVCRRYLEREGYEVDVAVDGQHGWEMFLQRQPDLVVLDLMMPKKDGWELCEDIRNKSDVPIIMLTALGEERDRLMGLTIGSDDYLVKPFSPRELVLRIQIILRRLKRTAAASQEGTGSNEVLKYEGMVIDSQLRRVFLNGQPVDLTVKEFDLLFLIAKRPGQVFSRMQLLDLIWESEYVGDASAVTVLVRRLREKIESNPSEPYWIHTVWGIGYRFEPCKGEKP